MALRREDDQKPLIIPLGNYGDDSGFGKKSANARGARLPADDRSDAYRLAFGASGIYAAFLYYGSLQEDVFRHVDPSNGERFTSAWFLQALEAAANVVVGLVGLRWYRSRTTKIASRPPLRQRREEQRDFFVTGASQVCAKAFTSLALARGLSFPVATLAKSAKMAPVMLGSLLLGGAEYTLREYLQVSAIVAGTVVLSMGKKKGDGSPSSSWGVVFIIASLVMDGVVGGVQKRLKSNMARRGAELKPYDFMVYTNLYMMIVAVAVSSLLGDFTEGVSYCRRNPVVLSTIARFSACSALGQSFVFYTVAHFDPLVCSTVTTTRKMLSVLLSVLTKGHRLDASGWCGVSVAMAGVASEVRSKIRRSSARKRGASTD